MEIIWHGTASIEVKSKNGCLLFDPFVPFPHAEIAVDSAEYDGFNHIFVTHGHFDHILSLPDIVKRNPQSIIHCTKTPYETLVRKGVPEGNLNLIGPDQTIGKEGFTVRVFQGKHAVLPKVGAKRIAYALKSPARGNVIPLLRENQRCPENGETLFYQIEADNTCLQLMGSLNLDSSTHYPTGADVLVLPYNGWDDNYPPAVRVIERLRPRRVLLDHYDDTFPPLTWPLDLSPILNYEDVPVHPLKHETPELL